MDRLETRGKIPSLHVRIERLRNDLGLSQPEFAERLGMDPKKGRSTINNWESRANKVKDDDLKKIAETFDVSADWLLGLTDLKTRDPQLKDACEYTGLSEQAVTFLHEYGKMPGSPQREKAERMLAEAMRSHTDLQAFGDMESSEQRMTEIARARLFPILDRLISEGHISNLVLRLRTIERDRDELRDRASCLNFDELAELTEKLEIDEFRLSQEILRIADRLFQVQELKGAADTEIESRALEMQSSKEGDDGEQAQR